MLSECDNDFTEYLKRINKIHHFINQYHWKDIVFHAHAKDLKRFETKLNGSNFLIVPHRKKEHSNKVILLKVRNSKKRFIS